MENKLEQILLDETQEQKLSVEAVATGFGLEIFAEGYGCCGMAPGHGSIVFLELYDGKLWLRVWTDINNEDPTYVIDMSGALETNRNEQDS
jgi:hypothetical protein